MSEKMWLGWTALLFHAACSLQTVKGAPEDAAWPTLLSGLSTSPAMVAPASPFKARFAFLDPGLARATPLNNGSSYAYHWTVELTAVNGTVLTTVNGTGTAGQVLLDVPACSACAFDWAVSMRMQRDGDAGSAEVAVSPPQRVFTPPHRWYNAERTAQVPSMWAPDNETNGTGPQFVLFRAQIPPQLTTPEAASSYESALLFLTADSPGRADTAPLGTRPLLSGYKAWVGGAESSPNTSEISNSTVLMGVGPGRSKCGLLGEELPTTICPGPGALEHVFDGYDVLTTLKFFANVSLFIEAYGYDQPASSGQQAAGVVSRRIAAELVLRFRNGTAWSSLDGGVGLTMEHVLPVKWQAYDADDIYLANLWAIGGGGHRTNNELGSSGGGSWYYYPHEYIDLSRLPEEFTPLAYSGVGAQSSPQTWSPSVSKDSFLNLVVRDSPPVDVTSIAEAVNVTQVGSGHILFDMGREVQGGIKLAVKSQGRDLNVTVRFAEELLTLGAAQPNTNCTTDDPNQVNLPCYDMRTSSRYQDVWILPAATSHVLHPQSAATGVASAENHEYIVGRFGELIFNDSSVLASDIVAVGVWKVTARYNATEGATMQTSSPELDSVWEFCRYTSEAMSLDLYADSNARQRSANCMADDNTAMRLAAATGPPGLAALNRHMLLAAMTMCGTVANRSCTAEWTVLPIIMLHDDILATGDLEFAQQNFDTLLGSALGLPDTPWPLDSATGLVNTTNVLIDWPPGRRDNYSLSSLNSVANAWSYRGLVAMADIAEWIGRPSDAKTLRIRAAALKAAINQLMFSLPAGTFCDGVCSETPHTSFHSAVYMLAFGAVEDENIASTWAYMKGRIAPLNDPVSNSELENRREGSWPPTPSPDAKDGMPCGTYVSQFAVQALFESAPPNDNGKTGVAILTSTAKNSWLNMLKAGATTTMEMWTVDEKPNLTWSHVWSASPGFLIPWLVFGIRSLAPGWQSFSIKPFPGSLSTGSYDQPTVRGPIKASFSKASGAFELSVLVPHGSTANVALPIFHESALSPVNFATLHFTVNGASVPLDNIIVRGGYAYFKQRIGAGYHKLRLQRLVRQ